MKQEIRKSGALCALLCLGLGLSFPAKAQNAAPPAADAPVLSLPAPAAAPATSDAAKPAKAAAAKAKAKPKPEPSPAKKLVVTVNNSRSVALTGLEVASGGGEPKRVLSALAAGKAATVKIERGKDCVYDLHGAYEDGSTTDMPGVDLCKIRKLNLVE